MQLYAITDRKLLPGDEAERQAALVRLVTRWVRCGVDHIQIREKDLTAKALGELASRIVQAVRETEGRSRVLLNGPAEIALESGCDGVHLPGNAPAGATEQAREIFRVSNPDPVISAACHNLEDIGRLKTASLLLFAPVFEKRLPGEQTLPGTGLEELRKICQAAGATPVFALGGITWGNSSQCIAAGAAGIAGIRLFLEVGKNANSDPTSQKPVR